MTSSDLTSKLGCFLAGALLPTIAYFIVGSTKNANKSSRGDHNSKDDEDDEYDSEEELQTILGKRKPSMDPKQWGVRDAPYKVRRVCCRLADER